MTRRFNVLLAFVLGLVFGVWTERGIQPAPATPPPSPVVRIVRIEQPAVQPAEPALPACLEDERVWGVGDYRGPALGWSRYVCRHMDWINDLSDPN
jgi:hypothetical protein